MGSRVDGDLYRFDLSPELAERVRRFNAARGLTMFMTMTATLAALLYRYSGQQDLRIGAPVANGLYSFALESYSGETLLDTQQGQVYAKVAEVRLDDKGAAMLVLEGGGKVAPADISGVR